MDKLEPRKDASKATVPTLKDAAAVLSKPKSPALSGVLLSATVSTTPLKELLNASTALYTRTGLDNESTQRVRSALCDAAEAIRLGDKNGASLIAKVVHDIVHQELRHFANPNTTKKPDQNQLDLAIFAVDRLGSTACFNDKEALNALIGISRTNSANSSIGKEALKQILSQSISLAKPGEFSEIIKSLGKDRLAEVYNSPDPKDKKKYNTTYPVIEALADHDLGFKRVELFKNLLTDRDALYPAYYEIFAKNLMGGVLSHSSMSRDVVVDALTEVANNGATKEVQLMAIEALAAPNILARRQLLDIVQSSANRELRLAAIKNLAKSQEGVNQLWKNDVGGSYEFYEEIVTTLRNFRREIFSDKQFSTAATDALNLIQVRPGEAAMSRLVDWSSRTSGAFKSVFWDFPRAIFAGNKSVEIKK